MVSLRGCRARWLARPRIDRLRAANLVQAAQCGVRSWEASSRMTLSELHRSSEHCRSLAFADSRALASPLASTSGTGTSHTIRTMQMSSRSRVGAGVSQLGCYASDWTGSMDKKGLAAWPPALSVFNDRRWVAIASLRYG